MSEVTTPEPPSLGDWELEKLREHYDRKRMTKDAISTVKGLFEGGERWLRGVDREVYRTKRMKPIDRERTLIAIFIGSGAQTALAIHTYWGLMEGLSPTDIEQTALLAGTYGGLPSYTFGMFVVKDTFAKLAALAHELDEPDDRTITRKLLGR